MHIKELYEADAFNSAALTRTTNLMSELYARPTHKSKMLLAELREIKQELVDNRDKIARAIWKVEQLEYVEVE